MQDEHASDMNLEFPSSYGEVDLYSTSYRPAPAVRRIGKDLAPRIGGGYGSDRREGKSAVKKMAGSRQGPGQRRRRRRGVSVIAASVLVAAAIFAFGAPFCFLLFLLAIAVVAALLAAALFVLLFLTAAAGPRLLAAPLLTLVLLIRIQVLLLLAAVLLDLTVVRSALLGLPAAVLPGAALLLTILLFVCHDQSPEVDDK